MTFPRPTIQFYADVATHQPTVLVLNHPDQGKLDSVYVLSGDLPIDVSEHCVGFSVRRGRSRALDEISAGTASLTFLNQDRTFDPSHAAGPYYGQIRPSKRMKIAYDGTVIMDGTVEDWNYDWIVDQSPLVYAIVGDALSRLARQEFDEWTTVAGQTAGPRIAAVLDRDEVRFGANRDLDDGVSTLQADLVTWGSNVLNYLQLVAKSELGRLFASRSNVLTFRDRHYGLNPTPAVTLTDVVDGGIYYNAIGFEFGSELLFNHVAVDREGGILQSADDAAAQDLDGVRALSLSGLLLDSDVQSAAMAEWLLGIYRDPEFRIASVQLEVSSRSSEDRHAILELDIADTVRVVHSFDGVGDPIDEVCIVEGVSHDHAASGLHRVTLHLTDVNDQSVFVLDDVGLGQFDENLLAF